MTAKKKPTKQTAAKKQAKAARKLAPAPGATKASKSAARTEDGKDQKRITSHAHAEATAALLADLERDAARKEAAAASKPSRKPKVGAPKVAKPPKPDKPKRTSLLDAAATVLREAKEPLGAKALVEQVASRSLWKPTKGGKTPHATLYAAMTREIAKKGPASRFAKVDRGAFAAGKGA